MQGLLCMGGMVLSKKYIIKMSNRKFNCTQNELFAACMIGWEICSRHIDKFTAFKPKYNPDFVKERQAELRNMMLLPSKSRRSAEIEQIRMKLRQLNDACIESCLKVKRHMDEVWSDADLSNRLKQSGFENLSIAKRYQFESTQVMMSTVSKFLVDNSQVLLANQNMAAGFPEAFEKLSLEFTASYTLYLDKVNKSELNTLDVIGSLNKLYQDLNSMLSDGKVIFRQDKDLKNQFSFNGILATVSGNGWAGIKGIVSLDGKVDNAFGGIQLTLVETGETVSPDAEGRYQFSQLKNGIYSMEIDAPGYKGQVFEEIVVNTGSYTLFNIDLQPQINNTVTIAENDDAEKNDPGS